ncbi:MAG TPA: carboxymuconolactone decarboxylase family protein [Stellaceae bacterium]|jgi:AhpD family alkylhydroperoxidase|nr:carboxymuconolactone decarboxylase family protein [Stellaceae bacterium]
MEARLSPYKLAPGTYQALSTMEKYVKESGLEPPLLELVKMRASQINGCAFCLAMHSRAARRAGESEDRLFLLNAWHEAPVYTPRERAALAWTEAVTLVSETHVPDEVFAEAKQHFSETELVNLTMAVIAINSWNRIAIAFRAQPQLGGN